MTNHPNRSRIHTSRVRETSDGRFWVETRIYDARAGKRGWNSVARFDVRGDAEAEASRLNERNKSAGALDTHK